MRSIFLRPSQSIDFVHLQMVFLVDFIYSHNIRHLNVNSCVRYIDECLMDNDGHNRCMDVITVTFVLLFNSV